MSIKSESGGKSKSSGQGIGASLLRKEDDRFMRGRGEYVANIRMVGMQDVAFARSPVAHAFIRSIEKPAGMEHAVFTLADLTGVKPIVANSTLKGFKSSEQPVLAGDKVRQVGEKIWRRRYLLISTSCRRWSTCWKRVWRRQLWCMSTGVTMCFWKPRSAARTAMILMRFAAMRRSRCIEN
jgi:hypothetical protein